MNNREDARRKDAKRKERAFPGALRLCAFALKKEMSPLTYILGWPLIAAIVLVFVPRNFRPVIRRRRARHVLSMLLAVKMFCQFVTGQAAISSNSKSVGRIARHQLSRRRGWLERRIDFDGPIVAFAAACCSFEIQSREKEFYILLLVMTGASSARSRRWICSFFISCMNSRSCDVHHDWRLGRGERKNYATFQITLYLSIAR